MVVREAVERAMAEAPVTEPVERAASVGEVLLSTDPNPKLNPNYIETLSLSLSLSPILTLTRIGSRWW